MKIEAKYREGLRQLMKTTPLDEINVVMLCEHVKSNRQTFYYHYRDISDVIESILLKERVGYGIRPYDFENIIKPLVAYINANTPFLVAVASSFASDKLEQFYYSYFYQRTSQYLKLTEKYDLSSPATNNHIVRYVASLFSKEMVFWTMNKRKEKPLQLQRRLTFIWYYFVDNYPKELKGFK